ncbi:hypothetical protein SAMN00790413_04938 [Deinococcus hopiensis KR-140]|uniref:Uncharacterized protein n=1 Tax=Deinococcus hopiensis KR-140 TaxID=695939 RepID=A0A1W1UT10_9DEIO|nr:hypothetical protein SAMN00790413_04938 [Deinococcus hopiensis KR-140]
MKYLVRLNAEEQTQHPGPRFAIPGNEIRFVVQSPRYVPLGPENWQFERPTAG